MKCNLCKNLKPGSIRFKLVTGMLVLWVSFVIVSALLAFFFVKKSNQESIIQKQTEMLHAVADDLDIRLQMMHDLLIAAAQTLPTEILFDVQKAQEWLNGKKELLSIFDNNIFIFTPEGRLFVESPFTSLERRGLDLSFREYIQKTLELKRPYISNPYITSQAHKSPVVMFTAPIFDEHGNIMAILTGSFNLFGKNGLTHIRDLQIGQHGFIMVLSSDSRILVHPDTEYIYKKIEPEANPELNRILNEHLEATYEEHGYKNASYLVCAKWLTYKDWVLLAYHSIQDIEEPLVKYQRMILLRAIIVLTLGIVFILWLANRCLKPLEGFAAHIRGLLNKKDEKHFFHYSGKDEIQDVSTAFNNLIKELDERYNELSKNEEIFKTLAIFSTDIIFWHNLNGDFIYISPNCLYLTGYIDAEFYANPKLLETIILPEDLPLWNQHIHGSGEPVIFRIRHRNGRIFWIRHECANILNEKSENIGFRGNLIDITSQKLAELALVEQKTLLHHLIDTLPVAVCLKDGQNRWLVANKQTLNLFGLPEDLDYFQKDEAELAAFAVNKDVLLHIKSLNEAAWQHKELYRTYEEFVAADKKKHILDVFKLPIFFEDGRRRYLIVVAVDVTELKYTEARLHQAQKMESVGQLAGGIAHDFNNILMAVQGYAELLRMKLTDQSLVKFVDNILKGTDRAARLVRHLLAFSRRQMLQFEHLDINEVIITITPLLKKTIRDDIELKIQASDNRLLVYADRIQLEQVLINLAANARDAMPNGGTLLIETSQVRLDTSYTQRDSNITPGDYVVISVSDTGCGMDEKTKESIFDPFFTTKEFGKGTGLGLAIVHGIVSQHKGFINVYSEVGIGTTFRIYLPLDNTYVQTTVQDVQQQGADINGSGVILLADDEKMIRDICASALQEAGYEVLVAKDGEEVVSLFEANANRIDLLLLDVLMPKKNGRVAYEEIKCKRPDIKALFLSGYSQDLLMEHGNLLNGYVFVSKPISSHELLKKIHEVLSERNSSKEA